LPCEKVWEEQDPEPEPHQNFYPEPEPHKNDAAPQHCFVDTVVYNLQYRIHGFEQCATTYLIPIHKKNGSIISK
jgi:hypothetical protein